MALTFQVHVFMFNIAPEPLDKNVVESSSPAIHTDNDTFPLQYAGEGIAGELGPLIAIEDLGLAVVA